MVPVNPVDRPAFLAEIYQKVAVRYVFMAEDLLKGPNREGDAIERADLMISRLRSDATIEGIVQTAFGAMAGG